MRKNNWGIYNLHFVCILDVTFIGRFHPFTGHEGP